MLRAPFQDLHQVLPVRHMPGSSQVVHRLAQKTRHLRMIQRLQAVTDHTVLDRLFRVCKLGITACYDQLYALVLLSHLAAELQSVYARHADIQNGNIDLLLLHIFQHSRTVRCRPHHFKPQLLPRNGADQRLHHRIFIICDQYPKHNRSLPRSPELTTPSELLKPEAAV